MSFSLHHFIHTHEIDKEKHEKLHAKGYVRFVDKVVFVGALLGPLATIPQVYKIYHTHNAQDISIATWLLYLVGAFFWLFYGFAHKNKPIIVSNISWILWQAAIIIGAILY